MRPSRSAEQRARLRLRVLRPLVALIALALIAASTAIALASTSVRSNPSPTPGPPPQGRHQLRRVADASDRRLAGLECLPAVRSGRLVRYRHQRGAQDPRQQCERGRLFRHRVASTTWSETATTAANAPAMSGAAVKSGPVTAGATVSVNVTSLVTGHGLVSLGLTANDGTAISLASRESAYPPTLVVTSSLTSAATPSRRKPTATPSPSRPRQSRRRLNADFGRPADLRQSRPSHVLLSRGSPRPGTSRA